MLFTSRATGHSDDWCVISIQQPKIVLETEQAVMITKMFKNTYLINYQGTTHYSTFAAGNLTTDSLTTGEGSQSNR